MKEKGAGCSVWWLAFMVLGLYVLVAIIEIISQLFGI